MSSDTSTKPQAAAQNTAPVTGGDDSRRDQALGELRTSQDLKKIVGSIERFLLNQIDRLQSALAESEKIAASGDVVQRLLVDFEQEKKQWLAQRDAELRAINEQKTKLAQGLSALEERQG